jgi:hypothetical protein
MNYGPAKMFKNVWFTSFKYEPDDGEPEYNKKWRWFEYYSYTREYQGDYVIFFFDEADWKKLIRKKYMVMWMLKGNAQ